MGKNTREIFVPHRGNVLLVRGNKRERVSKTQIILGQEFIEDGRLYQTSLLPAAFEFVDLCGSFRYRDQWYLRCDDDHALPLTPNMPFGRADKYDEMFVFTQVKVMKLEVTDRGLAK